MSNVQQLIIVVLAYRDVPETKQLENEMSSYETKTFDDPTRQD